MNVDVSSSSKHKMSEVLETDFPAQSEKKQSQNATCRVGPISRYKKSFSVSVSYFVTINGSPRLPSFLHTERPAWRVLRAQPTLPSSGSLQIGEAIRGLPVGHRDVDAVGLQHSGDLRKASV